MRTVAQARLRLCPKCQHEKECTLANFAREQSGRWSAWCKSCVRALTRERSAEWKTRIRELKDGQPCMDCGVTYPYYVMQYDHRPGEVKCFSVSVVRGGWKWEKVLAEIAKCDLICANCHARRTWQRSAEAGHTS